MLISEGEAKKLTAKILALSKADSATVMLSGNERANVRFANNTATTNGFLEDLSVSIESNFGKRSGTAHTSRLDDASLEAAVRKSEEIAHLAPENSEFMPPLGPQEYLKSSAYSESTAAMGPAKLAAFFAPVIAEAVEKKVTAAGFLDSGASVAALATSNGLFVYEKSTAVSCTVTARSHEGNGSGWAGRNYNDIARLDTTAVGHTAVRKCVDSRKPGALPPGKYTVVLEPGAVCDLVGFTLEALDARNADEGRSFFTKKGGGNRLGEKLFGENVTIFSDPNNDAAPGSIFSPDGLPVQKTNWIENGELRNLVYSRFWAQKQGREPLPMPTNLVMKGGDTSIDEMVRQTARGVLVTKFWYIRMVDPQTLVLTGLTRDGTFLIEDGKVKHAVNNFRFNESPVAVLNNIVALGESVRTRGGEVDWLSMSAPPLLVKDFTFSTISDAV